MKKILTKKRMKKINRVLENPLVQNVGKSLVSFAAIATLKFLVEKLPILGEIFVGNTEKRKKTLSTFYSENELQI